MIDRKHLVEKAVKDVSSNSRSNLKEITNTPNSGKSNKLKSPNQPDYHLREKPKYRGHVHRQAFFASIILGFVLFYYAKDFRSKLATIIYFASQLILFGVSSTYHTTRWRSNKKEKFMQQLDHASIFILIAGTKTAVSMSLFEFSQEWVQQMLIASWLISLFGTLKIFVWHNAPVAVNVAVYFIHGLSVVPFSYHFINEISLFHLICLIMGGVFYLTGGVLFALEKPVLNPQVFGFHEVFHIFTILGNLSFMIPIAQSILLSQ